MKTTKFAVVALLVAAVLSIVSLSFADGSATTMPTTTSAPVAAE